MATWEQMSRQCWQAALALESRKLWRSAVNRYYYAAFSAVTSEMRKRVAVFPQGYEHPPHTQIGRFIKKHMVQFTKQDRAELRDAMKRLYDARVEADYRYMIEIAESDVRSVRFDAEYILQSLSVGS